MFLEPTLTRFDQDANAQDLAKSLDAVLRHLSTFLRRPEAVPVFKTHRFGSQLQVVIPFCGPPIFFSIPDLPIPMEAQTAHQTLVLRQLAKPFLGKVKRLQSTLAELRLNSYHPFVSITLISTNSNFEFQTRLMNGRHITELTNRKAQAQHIAWRLGMILAARAETGDVTGLFKVGNSNPIQAPSAAKAILLVTALNCENRLHATKMLKAAIEDTWGIISEKCLENELNRLVKVPA